MKKYNVPLFTISLLLILIIVSGATAQRRIRAKVVFRNGEHVKGELIHVTRDSLTLQRNLKFKPVTIRVADVASIHVRRKGAYGLGVGVGATLGGIIGAVVGYASYKAPDCSYIPLCFDLGPEGDALTGSLIGAVAGGAVGVTLASFEKNFDIKGDQIKFSAFAHDYQFVKPPKSPYQKP